MGHYASEMQDVFYSEETTKEKNKHANKKAQIRNKICKALGITEKELHYVREILENSYN